MKKILIKIGSSSVCGGDGIFLKNISHLMNEISVLKEQYQVCLIISGAKASFSGYKSSLNNSSAGKQDHKIKMYSAGQVFLTNHLYSNCKKNNKMLSFLLTSAADIKENIVDICNKISSLMECKDTILCINGNDAVCPEGCVLNNDFLARQINNIIKFDFVFFLSSIDGVLDVNRKTIKTLNENTLEKVSFFSKTNCGSGGMEEKIENCKEIAKVGSKCYIINSFKKKSISKILEGKKIGTFVDF